ncbi:AAA family ATPase [Asanoa siamensis]|uniref:Kinase n=1 Tax=Asanoa siamensis TaxID=926357 RepID=A0ABQ4D3U9_9ACTN|nr:ATP-binding protein [Asanoa siamensis]GIF78215.1 hypothetical protein Asi02nite_77330 [Asanoa siamensis]
MATLFLIVGLPAAGKTTLARRLAAEHQALRLTPDEWMIPLFGESDPDGRRDVLEGRLVWVARETLRAGTDVVLDFGFWSRDERSALRQLAHEIGATCQVIYLPIDRETQLARIRHRQQITPEQTFPMSDADVDEWRHLFEVPDPTELAGTDLPAPPESCPDWATWTAARWPSSREEPG